MFSFTNNRTEHLYGLRASKTIINTLTKSKVILDDIIFSLIIYIVCMLIVVSHSTVMLMFNADTYFNMFNMIAYSLTVRNLQRVNTTFFICCLTILVLTIHILEQFEYFLKVRHILIKIIYDQCIRFIPEFHILLKRVNNAYANLDPPVCNPNERIIYKGTHGLLTGYSLKQFTFYRLSRAFHESQNAMNTFCQLITDCRLFILYHKRYNLLILTNNTILYNTMQIISIPLQFQICFVRYAQPITFVLEIQCILFYYVYRYLYQLLLSYPQCNFVSLGVKRHL